MKLSIARAWLVAAMLGVAASSAFAGDMPERYLPPPRTPSAYVPFFTWNGFYLGINGGYGFGNSRWTDTFTSVSSGDFSISGGLLGGTAGYNIQQGAWVFGVEGDMDWSDIKGTASGCPACTTASNWIATLRGRAGYAFDRFLPYLTGGAAFGNVKGTIAGVGSFTDVNVGWSAGGGLEYAFIGNWSAKLEYLYVDLGNGRCSASCSGGNPFDVSFSTSIVRGGLNYRF